MIRSPNIWDSPDVYEVENRASDRAGIIDSTMAALHPFAGSTMADIGCGSGFHLPRFAARGARVVGIEPYLPLVKRAQARAAEEGSPSMVLVGGAEHLPLRDQSIDVAHARWAYFFGAGCEPGLTELARVIRPGGIAFIIDNDVTRSTFGSWFRMAHPAYDPVAVQRFWNRQGFTTERLTIDWSFDSREDLDAVTRIELPPATAGVVLNAHQGLTVDYGVALRWRRY
ncbi:MAG: class I SAM-dependent methyltransferase [Ornithinibacter sp.]